jgi:hypothetical protein
MKKIATFPGGHPIRPDDFELVQNQALLTAFEIIHGLTDSDNACIVSGLKLTTVGINNTVSKGYFWDGTELCYVPEFHFETEEGNTVYLVLNETTTSNRRFRDNSYNDVQVNREYAGSYANIAPANSFNYQTLSKLVNLLSIAPDNNAFQLTQSEVAVLNPNFAHALGQPGTALHVLKNTYNEIMIICYFTSAVTNGIIANITLPIAITNEIMGYFWNGSAVGHLKIAPNGDISLSGIATGAVVNTIQFQINLNAVLPS